MANLSNEEYADIHSGKPDAVKDQPSVSYFWRRPGEQFVVPGVEHCAPLRSPYRESRGAVVCAKHGEPWPCPNAEPSPTVVPDLMANLRASLDRAKAQRGDSEQ